MSTRLHLIVDRDGVLNREPTHGWVTDPADWSWEDAALEALAECRRSGVRVSVATNQSCIGRGLATERDVALVHRRMREEALGAGGRIDAVFVCPHAPNAGCWCRKPLPGLVSEALFAARLQRSRSLFVGDAIRDLEAGAAAEVPRALVRTGKGAATERLEASRGVPVYDDLLSAVRAFLAKFSGS